MKRHGKIVGILTVAASVSWMFFGWHRAPTGSGSAEPRRPATATLRSPLSNETARTPLPLPQRAEESDAAPAMRAAAADRKRVRHVRVRGTMIVVQDTSEPGTDSSGDTSPEVRSPSREPLDPLSHGFSHDDLMRSILVESPTLRASTSVDGQGRFVLEGDLPESMETVRVRFTSNFVMSDEGRPEARVSVRPTSPEPYVVFRVRPALVAAPRYHGKMITPRELTDPAVREEFLRQMSDIANLVLTPPTGVGPPPS